jgi:curved DNA-binding protein CbpA
MSEDEAESGGESGVFLAASLSLILVPLSLNWCVKVRAKVTGRQPGEPHYRSGTWILVYTLIIAAGWALLVHLGSQAATTAAPFNPFEIIGVSEDASEREIKKAYRKLSMIHHPDKGGDEATFQQLSAAYRALTDPVSRENYELYGHPDGRQAFAAGVALPEFMMDESNQGVMLLIYMTLLVGAPACCLFGGGLRRPTVGDPLKEAQKSLLQHFSTQLGDGARTMTHIELLSILASAPPLLPEQISEEEKSPQDETGGDSANDESALEDDALVQAVLATIQSSSRKVLAAKLLNKTSGAAHRVNLALLLAHFDRSTAKDGSRSNGAALSGLSAAHAAQLELLLSCVPQLMQALVRVAALGVKKSSVVDLVVRLSAGMQLGIWPDDNAVSEQKKLLKPMSLGVPTAIVEGDVGVEDEETIAEGDVVTCQATFKRQNSSTLAEAMVLLCGKPLSDDHEAAARLPQAKALARESSARQLKVKEFWVVNVSTPSGECLSMWPLHGAPPAPKSTSAGMKWKQQSHGRCRYTLSAASLDCFSECSKQLVFNVLSQAELEKQISEADQIYTDDD